MGIELDFGNGFMEPVVMIRGVVVTPELFCGVLDVLIEDEGTALLQRFSLLTADKLRIVANRIEEGFMKDAKGK